MSHGGGGILKVQKNQTPPLPLSATYYLNGPKIEWLFSDICWFKVKSFGPEALLRTTVTIFLLLSILKLS